MAFGIGFTGETTPEGARLGRVALGAQPETFAADTRHFSPDRYERQWRQALEMALHDRAAAALFQSVSLDAAGVGRLWLYPVIPSELAGANDRARALLKDFPAREADGLYLGERFLDVTTDPEAFRRRIYMEFDDGSRGEEIALHYLDLDAPERVFGYLDHDLALVSHWYVPNAAVAAFLAGAEGSRQG